MTDTSSTAPTTESRSPRRPWVAAVLSVLLAGLGHLYSGLPRRAVTFWLLNLGGGLLVVVIATVLPSRFLLPWAVIATVVLIGSIAWDAVRCARVADPDFVLRPYNRWYIYAAIVLVALIFVQPRYLRLVRSSLEAYSLPTASMEPTLLLGDYILAKRLRDVPVRGEIVVYRSRGVSYVKRILGLPGDTLAMRAGTLFVNKQPLHEPYVSTVMGEDINGAAFDWQRHFLLTDIDSSAYHPTLTTWGPIVVPPDGYFLLGDNRGDSFDSRFSGFVLLDSLIERPIAVYFSRDSRTGAVRWNRIGSTINNPE